MQQYLDIVRVILRDGVEKENRTGITRISIPSSTFEHDMSKGFPLLTTKKISFKNVASELEFFIKGITDKRWLQERNNHIWDSWCNPTIVPYATDEETKKRMRKERDLGPIYGWQWRHFGADYKGFDKKYAGEGFDQFARMLRMLKEDPTSARIYTSAWNPKDEDKMALLPCHYGFQVTVADGTLHLNWQQRSVDVPRGLPYNIASYAILLHLLAKEFGFKEGKLTGQLGDTHIYKNQIVGINKQVSRTPKQLPKIITEHFTSFDTWQYTDSKVINYEPHPLISFGKVAV